MPTVSEFYREHQAHLPLVSQEGLEACQAHLDFLRQHNPTAFLVSKSALENPFAHHYADSWWIGKFLSEKVKNRTLYDIGTGGGFPGLVVGLCYPHLKCKLYEREKKKFGFLEAFLKLHPRPNIELRGLAPIPMPPGFVISRGVFKKELILGKMKLRLSQNQTLVLCLSSKQQPPRDSAFHLVDTKHYELPLDAGGRTLAFYVPRET